MGRFNLSCSHALPTNYTLATERAAVKNIRQEARLSLKISGSIGSSAGISRVFTLLMYISDQKLAILPFAASHAHTPTPMLGRIWRSSRVRARSLDRFGLHMCAYMTTVACRQTARAAALPKQPVLKTCNISSFIVMDRDVYNSNCENASPAIRCAS